MSIIQYRKDIDGIRALAVLPIVLFHAGIQAIPGGFIGVDIFFVISGYLITRIILVEQQSNSFSLLEFYRRRAARIFPALIAMLAIVLIACLIVMLPNELSDAAKSAAASAGFVSNIYFWATANYFSADAEFRPLIHTWSLAVEEQFYLFYPLFLIVLHRLPKRAAVGAMVLLTAVSFALDLRWSLRESASGFYLLPGRAWELGLGGLIAMDAIPAITDRNRRALAAFLGLGMIATGLVLIDAKVWFPAPWALLPTLGSGLLIAYGAGTPVGSLLAHPFPRWFGKISYSLYLWHWPVIAFWRLRTGSELTVTETVPLIAVSTLCGYLSYRFIEIPARTRLRNVQPLLPVLGGIGILAGIGLTSIMIASNAAYLSRAPEAAKVDAAYVDYWKGEDYRKQYQADHCFARYDRQSFDLQFCLTPQHGQRNILLLGDSHAAQQFQAISERVGPAKLLQATASGCFPVLDATGSPWCTTVMKAALDRVLRPGSEIQTVIFSARWNTDQITPLKQTVAALKAKGIRMIVIGPIVEYDGSFPNLLARTVMQGDEAGVARFRLAERADLDARMGREMRAIGAEYVSIQQRECGGGICQIRTADGAPFHTDYGHVTIAASRYLMAALPPL